MAVPPRRTVAMASSVITGNAVTGAPTAASVRRICREIFVNMDCVFVRAVCVESNEQYTVCIQIGFDSEWIGWLAPYVRATITPLAWIMILFVCFFWVPHDCTWGTLHFNCIM